MGKTLFEKIWDAHVVQVVKDGPTQLYVDRLYGHEVTTPQAFDTLRDKGIKVFRPNQVIAMPDHNTPSDQQEVINDPVGRKQVDTLTKNCAEALCGSAVRAMATVPRALLRPLLASFCTGGLVGLYCSALL